MNSRTTARKIGRYLTAVTMLVVSLLLPVAPVLAAVAKAGAQSCECCRRAAKKCDFKAHRSMQSGPSWNESMDCGGGCANGSSFVPSAIFVAAASFGAIAHGVRTEPLFNATVNPLASSYSAWLYQRPPPRN